MSKHLDVGIKAVKAGAKIALKHFNNNVVVNYKKDNSPVSQADTEVEEKIKEIILNEFPDAKFLGEESGGDIRGKEFWVIDPIDGTRNYVRNHQLWGILLAFVKDGQVVVGV